MKFWNELDGSKFFSMVFSGNVVIDRVKLFSLSVDNNQSTLSLLFDIKELPDTVPEKWKEISYNACRIGITGSEVEGLIVKQLPTSEYLKLTIEKAGSCFLVSAKSERSMIEFTASFIALRDPTVYLTKTPFV
ncbi:immunity 50 family protein [Pseudomonas sp. 14P_8.1_Bac3]|uniref:immunity 50 family protein n=1 Tax=Pseudomonas sp. 14P_8.1_Bac3 TaxID=2971621 RepID=UPI0021C930AF|nr:immunity 50 family protein [Pseudomonas sp. 14P_8.1_Bac3]MCU1763670.1 immunity 50 family protein [Pseudomonas sp. 14P_8.1_Bac3]